MKDNMKHRLDEVKQDIAQAAEKIGDLAEDKMDDVKDSLKRGRSKLKHKL